MNTHFLTVIDILGTFAFTVSGAFAAMQKKLDPFGVIVIAFVTAIGGGTLRDMLIGNFPVRWLTNETLVTIIFVSTIASMFFQSYLKQLAITLLVFDALGLGLFTIIGIEAGLEKNLSMGICIALGTITASFGGVIRDVLLNNVPLIFQKEIYAMACVLGGLVYLLLKQTVLDADVSKIIAILVIFAIRMIAVRWGLSLPQFKNEHHEKI